MRHLKKLKITWALLAGIGLGLGAGLIPGEAANAQGQQPANACWQCTVDSDCDTTCGGPGAGVCVWHGCTYCACYM
jgi:hypothetical protein